MSKIEYGLHTIVYINMHPTRSAQEYLRTFVSSGSDVDESGERERGVRYWKFAKLPRQGYWLLVEDERCSQSDRGYSDSYIFGSFFQLREAFSLGRLNGLRLYVYVPAGGGATSPEALFLRLKEVYSAPNEEALMYVAENGVTLLDLRSTDVSLEKLVGMRRMYPVFSTN